MAYHTWLVATAPLPLSAPLAALASFGGSGVFLFFVISGFSLTMTMPRHLATGRPWLSYALSRLFRIAPLFYAVTAWTALRAARHGAAFGPAALALNATFLFNLVPGQQAGIAPASWTIGVEMLFYLAFPLLDRLGLDRLGLARQAAVLLATQLLLALVWPRLSPDYRVYSVLGCLPIFFAGMWSFAPLRRLGEAGPGKRWLGRLVIAAGIGVLAGQQLLVGRLGYTLAKDAAGLGYAAVLVGVGLQAPGFLDVRLLRFLGTVSYSVYLLHWIVVTGVDTRLAPRLAALPADANYAVRLLAVLAVPLPLAALADRLIERPAERAGRALVRRLTAAP